MLWLVKDCALLVTWAGPAQKVVEPTLAKKCEKTPPVQYQHWFFCFFFLCFVKYYVWHYTSFMLCRLTFCMHAALLKKGLKNLFYLFKNTHIPDYKNYFCTLCQVSLHQIHHHQLSNQKKLGSFIKKCKHAPIRHQQWFMLISHLLSFILSLWS